MSKLYFVIFLTFITTACSLDLTEQGEAERQRAYKKAQSSSEECLILEGRTDCLTSLKDI